jgi:prophage tail gpP-like protein
MPRIPNPDEVATIVVDGIRYEDWTSVMVQHRWMEAYPVFEFSTAEVVPRPKSFDALRFNVGARATIYLGGIQAIDGVITVRQSAMDAKTHGVQLIGKGLSWYMAKSSLRTQTSNFDGMNIVQVAQTVCAQFGVGVAVVGTPDMTPFPKLQAAPGEPAFDFLEQCCRVKSCILGSDASGHILLIGQHQDTDDGDWLIEGENIERINVIFNNETVYANYYAVGQQPGDDLTWGIEAAQLEVSVGGGNDPGPSALVIPSELNNTLPDLMTRAEFEARMHNGTWLRVTATVPGWKRRNGDLWRVGNAYHVRAPDHLPFDMVLDAQTVTFRQSEEEGTTTTLELVLPWLLNGSLMAPGLPSAPPPADSTPFDQTVKNPPAPPPPPLAIPD